MGDYRVTDLALLLVRDSGSLSRRLGNRRSGIGQAIFVAARAQSAQRGA